MKTGLNDNLRTGKQKRVNEINRNMDETLSGRDLKSTTDEVFWVEREMS